MNRRITPWLRLSSSPTRIPGVGLILSLIIRYLVMTIDHSDSRIMPSCSFDAPAHVTSPDARSYVNTIILIVKFR